MCQKVLLPSSSFQVRSRTAESLWMGRLSSTILSSTFAAKILRAKPSLMLFAMSNAVIPASYCLTEPSGNVIFIMIFDVLIANILGYKSTKLVSIGKHVGHFFYFIIKFGVVSTSSQVRLRSVSSLSWVRLRSVSTPSQVRLGISI